jgi:hypothetical protein
MSPRRLRDDLRDLFDELSEPAHPALAGRIHRDIVQRPSLAPRAPRLAVAVAALVSLAIVAGLLVAGRHAIAPRSTPAGQTTASPAPTAAATPLPSPGSSSTAPAATAPPAAVLPGFSCASQTGGGGTSALTGVRAGIQAELDRFVIQFDGPIPPYQVVPQASSTFTGDPKGAATLGGTAGLRVTVSRVSNWTSLAGPTDLRPSPASVLEEARQVGAFEGVVTWGLGLSHPACFRAYTLTGPNRLVIDIQH